MTVSTQLRDAEEIIFRHALVEGNMGWQFRERFTPVVKAMVAEALTLQGDIFENEGNRWKRVVLTYTYMNLRGRNLDG